MRLSSLPTAVGENADFQILSYPIGNYFETPRLFFKFALGAP